MAMSRRRRLGVDAQARLARTRELAPLVVTGPTPGRLILGRAGRQLVATEDAHAGRPARGRGARRGDRSSVLVIGPTRCGKTANAVAGILDWSGPTILSSVKADLMSATLAARFGDSARSVSSIPQPAPTSRVQVGHRYARRTPSLVRRRPLGH